MPYIKWTDRFDLSGDNPLRGPENAGELNYMITILLLDYWNTQKQNYQTLNDIIGALEGAKMEFYRRVVVPYEDDKIKQNGDVY